MKVMYLNFRSIRNKAKIINDVIDSNQTDLIFITESWLSPSGDEVLITELTPPGYKCISNPRSDRAGGGIAIIHKDYIKKIKYEIINNFSSFECSKFTASNTTFIILYHPPPSDVNKTTNRAFVDEFQLLIESIIDTTDRLIFIGDFNIQFDVNDTYTLAMKSILSAHGLTQHILLPTHEKGHIIDWVITKSESEIVTNVQVGDMLISDHRVITFDIDRTSPPRPKKDVASRNIKAINISRFCQDISFLLSSQDEINADDLNTILRSSLDKHAPLKVRTVTDRPSSPWIDDNILRLKQQRRAAERKWRKTRNNDDRRSYKNLRDQVVNEISLAKQDYYSRKISACSSSKTLFSIVNEMCGKEKSSRTYPTDIPEASLPETFISYFTDKVSSIRSSLDNAHSELIDLTKESSHNLQPNFHTFREVNSKEVREIIMSSPPKTCELDPIPTQLLVSCLDVILDPITKIINDSLISGHVPSCYKKAIVSPLLKKSNLDHNNLKNYRPVSNLPFISKILEKVVLKQMKEYLNANNLFEQNQSAYREFHSTETALLKITNDILLSCDAGDMSILTLLDLSAAFDTIDHSVLCHTLSEKFGFCGNVLAWFQSYLCGRSQCVMLNGKTSDFVDLKFGVPQGSVLGPVLYTLYTVPLSNVIKNHSINFHMYADDTQLYKPFSNTNIDDALSDVEGCSREIKNWMCKNKLKLNDEKSEVIICGTKSKTKNLITSPIIIGDSVVPFSNNVKNLGIILDNALTMNSQIDHMVRIMNMQLRKIYQIRQYLPFDSIRTVVCSLVLSRLDYCNSLLAGLPDSSIVKLQRVQNRAARIALGLHPFDRTSPKEMFRTLHWLPVRARIEYKIALLCFNALHSRSPQYIEDLLVPYKPSRQLRSSNNNFLSVPKTRLKGYGDRTFSKFGPKTWNSLPLFVRSVYSVESFKLLLKTHLFNSYLH